MNIALYLLCEVRVIFPVCREFRRRRVRRRLHPPRNIFSTGNRQLWRPKDHYSPRENTNLDQNVSDPQHLVRRRMVRRELRDRPYRWLTSDDAEVTSAPAATWIQLYLHLPTEPDGHITKQSSSYCNVNSVGR